ncbi:hypothetical protein ACD591_08200 [Rufibacter glacialis]|uniref:Lipoprotein n=1 Tax=Rufibacter glacialis TaxID=1259555 RepID=A0A5M8QCE7_9BACT|nr:hypothetical protein [Rufibacter glacialis]KAA6432570.1 hypothetical protein FOE74_15910 [Rufibacter glacialis]GGK79910.1 hypothetical protein GCM10011405_29630 [Rufibacter glacialis]
MNRVLCSCFLVLLISCRPEKDADAPAVDQTLGQTVDSVSNTRIDGTATASSPPLDIKQQIPELLEAHLNRTHAAWKFPTLTEFDVQRVPQEEQGPYFIEADFNGDTRLDYAIQVVERDSAYVYVFLRDKENGFQEYLLEQDQLYDIDAQKRSIRYLTLAEKAHQYHDYGTRKTISIPHDGVSVGAENYTATYVWDNGKFKKYETGD